jgi:hypothetical protein
MFPYRKIRSYIGNTQSNWTHFDRQKVTIKCTYLVSVSLGQAVLWALGFPLSASLHCHSTVTQELPRDTQTGCQRLHWHRDRDWLWCWVQNVQWVRNIKAQYADMWHKEAKSCRSNEQCPGKPPNRSAALWNLADKTDINKIWENMNQTTIKLAWWIMYKIIR